MDLGVAAREGTTGVASDVRERKKSLLRSVSSFVFVCVGGVLGREGKEEMRKGGHLEIEICKQKLCLYATRNSALYIKFRFKNAHYSPLVG